MWPGRVGLASASIVPNPDLPAARWTISPGISRLAIYDAFLASKPRKLEDEALLRLPAAPVLIHHIDGSHSASASACTTPFLVVSHGFSESQCLTTSDWGVMGKLVQPPQQPQRIAAWAMASLPSHLIQLLSAIVLFFFYIRYRIRPSTPFTPRDEHPLHKSFWTRFGS